LLCLALLLDLLILYRIRARGGGFVCEWNLLRICCERHQGCERQSRKPFSVNHQLTSRSEWNKKTVAGGDNIHTPNPSDLPDQGRAERRC